MLLEAGASPSAEAGSTGRTALHLAADCGHTDCVLRLLQGVSIPERPHIGSGGVSQSAIICVPRLYDGGMAQSQPTRWTT